MNKTIEIFARGAKDGVYPGGQLTVSRECQRVITASVGKLGHNDEPVTHQTHYDLASLTKVLATNVLFGRALEQGLCEITDPLAKYVPGVNPNMSLEHALEHTTGLPAHIRLDEDLPPEIPHESWDAWRHIVRSAATTQSVRPPGVKAEYSDVGFILLGAALEAMYGQPLSTSYALLGTNLFFRDRRGPPSLPLFPVSAPVACSEPHVRPGFVHDENARAMGGAAGHAGLFGTASGILKVAEDLVMSYHGYTQGLLQPATIRRLWQPSLVENSTRTLGWDRPDSTKSSTGGQWPRNSVGHLGFTGCSLWIEPDRALIAVLVTNRVWPSRSNNLIRRLRPSLHNAIWEEWGNAKSSLLVNQKVNH
jgi:serine-type D-Ala-D-Ala carboxypeptidase